MNDSKIIELGVDQLEGVAGGAGGYGTTQGSFQSNTGTYLDIVVSWSAVDNGAGSKTLNVDVSTLSYKLYTSADYNGVQLTVNGAVYTTGGRAISFGGSGRVTNPLASFSVPNVSGTLQVSVSWRFNGTYNGTPLKTITAQSTISI